MLFHFAAHLCLWTLSNLVVTLTRLAAPASQPSVALSHGVYGARHWAHCSAYLAAPGWLFVEIGAWTIEASWRTRIERSRLKFTA